MMIDQSGYEYTWEMLLSRDAQWILAAFGSLEPDQQKIVLEHLHKMVAEPGWQPGQRISAQAALDVITQE